MCIFFIILFVGGVFIPLLRQKVINLMLGRKNQVAVKPIEDMIIEPKKITDSVKLITVIAKDSHFEGTLRVKGDIKIWGCFKGNLYVTGGIAQVMKGGGMEGEIEAENVTINGKVQGKCSCINLEIQDEGELSGTCCCENISISKGGKFLGQSEVLDDKMKKKLSVIKDNGEGKLVKVEKKENVVNDK